MTDVRKRSQKSEDRGQKIKSLFVIGNRNVMIAVLGFELYPITHQLKVSGIYL